MINTLEKDNEIIDLTPTIALDYLKFQDTFENTKFLSIRNNVIDNGFSDEKLCKEIYDLRGKRLDLSTITGQISFENAFNTIFWPKIKDNQKIDKKEFKSLIGTLMHAVKKINIFTNYGQKKMVDVFADEFYKREVEKQKKQKKINKRNNKMEEARQKQLNKMKKEMEINPELYKIYYDLKNQKTNSKSMGENLNREELEEIFDEAWNLFVNKRPSLSKDELNKIYDNFYIHIIG